MKFKLILLQDPIIVSDEKVKVHDLCIDLTYDSEGQPCYNIYKKRKSIGQQDTSTERKIIARGNKIDWNGLEKEFGYVDVEKLAIKIYGPVYSRESVHDFVRGCKAMEIITGKKFTYEDMELCYNTAARNGKRHESGLEADKGFEAYYNYYHKGPKMFDIELEMEEANTVISGGLRPVGELGGKGLQYHTTYRPKITNGKIKILRKL